MESYKSNKNKSELAGIFGRPRRAIGSVIKKLKEFGSTENRCGKGRKKLFTDRDSTQLSRVAKLNRRRSFQDITSIINVDKEHCFCKKNKTIQRKLAGLEYKRKTARKQVVGR